MSKKDGKIGICISDISSGVGIRKQKYSSEKFAKISLDKAKEIDVADPTAVLYHCTICGAWHVGKPELKEKYGKK